MGCKLLNRINFENTIEASGLAGNAIQWNRRYTVFILCTWAIYVRVRCAKQYVYDYAFVVIIES